MAGRKLVFRRVGKAAGSTTGFAESPGKPYSTKEGHHPLRGAMKGMIRIAPGVDLTEPAFPEWADVLDKKYGPEKR
jgi:hypothetical protein